jgi:hypothetical protein
MYYLVLTLIDCYIYILHGQISNVWSCNKQWCLHISYVSIIPINIFFVGISNKFEYLLQTPKTWLLQLILMVSLVDLFRFVAVGSHGSRRSKQNCRVRRFCTWKMVWWMLIDHWAFQACYQLQRAFGYDLGSKIWVVDYQNIYFILVLFALKNFLDWFLSLQSHYGSRIQLHRCSTKFCTFSTECTWALRYFFFITNKVACHNWLSASVCNELRLKITHAYQF